MGRGDLTDQQWQRLEPLLPAQKPKTGRPGKDHRTVINGILWVLRTGALWRDLPERYGPWRTAATRFYRWRQLGLWDPLLAEVQQQADAAGQIDWEVHYVDGTVVRAHQHAAATKRGRRPGVGALPGSIWNESPRTGGGPGKPVAFVLTPGQQHEATVFEELMTQGAAKRPGRGRPRSRPERVCGDKGYSSRKIRAYLRRRGTRHTIPRKKNEGRTGPFDRVLYRTRNLVERAINRLKQFRRIASRYEKRVENYLSMLQIASILLWL